MPYKQYQQNKRVVTFLLDAEKIDQKYVIQYIEFQFTEM